MGFVHRCSFCDWAREAGSAVVLPPSCPECGCRVDSMTAAEADRASGDAPVERVPATRRRSRALRVGLAFFALVYAAASARLGYVTGGGFGIVIALGVAGFLLLPFVPERGAPRTSGT